ncbi:carbohydrate ABC transporter permease [Jiangella aurantiaca]|uniref:Carbohydrate ABC transporter permease n=1 Tax=Jiangella aurantiaca TaxID=2530373 RepID=A0A4R5ANM5_9ACTN|nr:carbohydrate ABC transporter permease [Jiangella aurantiaca]TDD72634.1 carbohydrate ABC transporter permease [Jiangella aurantiaca]
MAALLPKVGMRQPKLRLSRAAIAAFLGLGVLLHLLPFYYIVSTSLKPGAEVVSTPPTFIPSAITLDAWKLVLQIGDNAEIVQLVQEPFWVYFVNSAFITLLAVGLGLPVTALAAYANSKLQSGRSARLSFLFFIGTMMVPFVVTLVPMYLLTLNFPFTLPDAPTIPGTDSEFPTLRLWDTPWAVILPAIFVPFNFLLFKGFFDTIPDSVINAARVDGGSELNIFRRIVMPMAVPVFAVTAYMSFGSVWDNFLWQLVTLQSPDKVTMSVATYQLIDRLSTKGTTGGGAAAQAEGMSDLLNSGLTWNGMMVLAILQSIPIFIAFLVCREYLLRGIKIRGLK